MKKQPRKTKQWAEEAYSALGVAWDLLSKEYPNANDEEKLEVVSFAPAIAGLNRGISNRTRIKNAYEFIYERTVEDLRNKEKDDPFNYSILFLLGYLDSHISFGILSEKKVDEIMEYMSDNYNISYEP